MNVGKRIYKYALLEKRVGETPLQALEAFRDTHSELKNIPMTYAGRLDPMAEGKLIVLIGDECKKRDEYTKLDKEYEFEILFGVSSDTGDILGLAQGGGKVDIKEVEVKKVTNAFLGTQTLFYPAFSSKTVNGRPLFEHALSGSLKEIEIPSVDVEIYRLKSVGFRIVERTDLYEAILGKIGLLSVEVDTKRLGSDFRKDAILTRWKEGVLTEKTYVVARFSAVVSSGTYIRVLAPLIAHRLGTTGLAYSIHRIKIGRYLPLWGDFGFWTNTF